jgi:hypothetical protein
VVVPVAVAAHPREQPASASPSGGSPAPLPVASAAVGVDVRPPAGATRPGPIQQTVAVEVRGGSISVSPATEVITLRQAGGGSFHGVLGPVDVTDARGTLTGWAVTARLVSDTPGSLQLHLAAAHPVSGRPGEAQSVPTVALGPAASTIMFAPTGGGGGEFAVSGSIDLDGAAVGDGGDVHVVVQLALTTPT